MTTENKQPSQRRVISLSAAQYDQLASARKEIEDHLKIGMTYGQVITYIINRYKEIK